MSSQKIIEIVVAAVVIAGVAFYVGTMFTTTSPYMPSVQTTTAAPSVSTPSTPAQPLYGTVESTSASSMIVTLPDGTTRQFSLGVGTQVSEGTVLKHVSDLAVGMAVMVALVPGSTDAVQYIQILPPPPGH